MRKKVRSESTCTGDWESHRFAWICHRCLQQTVQHRTIGRCLDLVSAENSMQCCARHYTQALRSATDLYGSWRCGAPLHHIVSSRSERDWLDIRYQPQCPVMIHTTGWQFVITVWHAVIWDVLLTAAAVGCWILWQWQLKWTLWWHARSGCGRFIRNPFLSPTVMFVTLTLLPRKAWKPACSSLIYSPKADIPAFLNMPNTPKAEI